LRDGSISPLHWVRSLLMAMLAAFARRALAAVGDLGRALFAVAFVAERFVLLVVLDAVAVILCHGTSLLFRRRIPRRKPDTKQPLAAPLVSRVRRAPLSGNCSSPSETS